MNSLLMALLPALIVLNVNSEQIGVFIENSTAWQLSVLGVFLLAGAISLYRFVQNYMHEGLFRFSSLVLLALFTAGASFHKEAAAQMASLF